MAGIFKRREIKMNKICLLLLMVLLAVFSANAQASTYDTTFNPSTGWYVKDSGIATLSSNGSSNIFNFTVTSQWPDLTKIPVAKFDIAFASTSKALVEIRLYDDLAGAGSYISLANLNTNANKTWFYTISDVSVLNNYIRDGSFSLKIIDSQTKDVVTSSVRAAVPIPGAAWLLGAGLMGLVAIRRAKK
jgi:hypothetical protein